MIHPHPRPSSVTVHVNVGHKRITATLSMDGLERPLPRRVASDWYVLSTQKLLRENIVNPPLHSASINLAPTIYQILV